MDPPDNIVETVRVYEKQLTPSASLLVQLFDWYFIEQIFDNLPVELQSAPAS